MERIVLGISAINFNNSNDFVTEKSESPSPNIWKSETLSYTMATATPEAVDSPADYQSPEPLDSPVLPPLRRNLPARLAKCKENSLFHIKRRSIIKPRRNLSASMSEVKMRPAEIKKLYLENKIKGNFRPSNLETIFEEPTPDKNKQLCFIGAKKIRRSLSCSDGLNFTKTAVKTRRMKIKRTFGRPFALKKISLEEFICRLNASFEDKPAMQPSAVRTEDDFNKTDENVSDGDMECADETFLLT